MMRVRREARDRMSQERTVLRPPYGDGVEPAEQAVSALSPEQRLLLAILERALADLHSRHPDQATEARAFVASAACDALCEWLGYSATPLRQLVARHGFLP
jgi:hypothetical protein